MAGGTDSDDQIEARLSRLFDELNAVHQERQKRIEAAKRAGHRGLDQGLAIDALQLFPLDSFAHLPMRQRLKRVGLFPIRLTFRCALKTVRFVLLSIDSFMFHGRLLGERPWRRGRIASLLFRRTPTILVCMPFRNEAEIAYRYVIKPVVQRLLQARCIRLSYPTDGDWRRSLRSVLLSTDVVVFDMSFASDNVRAELHYYEDLLMEDINNMGSPQRWHVYVVFDGDPGCRAVEEWARMEGEECVTYLCSPFALTGFSKELLKKLERAMARLGYKRRFLDAWVMYPGPPPSSLENPFAESRDVRARERKWVDNAEL